VQPVDFNSAVRLPSDQKVQPDGTIDLIEFGQLVVTGMSLDEIRDAVERKIAAKERKKEKVDVQLTEPESQVYYVVGEVNSPASYPLIGRETILDALLTAGGLTDKADRHNVILSRPTMPDSCRSVLPICYRHIVELGDASTNYQIMPGDRIYVPSVPLGAQLFRAVFPYHGERCPRCADAQVPCPPDAAGAIGMSFAPATQIDIEEVPTEATRREAASGELGSYVR
jgi:protein involved in polysaccharide export with SLBB domain